MWISFYTYSGWVNYFLASMLHLHENSSFQGRGFKIIHFIKCGIGVSSSVTMVTKSIFSIISTPTPILWHLQWAVGENLKLSYVYASNRSLWINQELQHNLWQKFNLKTPHSFSLCALVFYSTIYHHPISWSCPPTIKKFQIESHARIYDLPTQIYASACRKLP